MLGKLEQKQNYNKNLKNKNLIFTPIFGGMKLHREESRNIYLYEKPPLIFDKESSPKIFRNY